MTDASTVDRCGGAAIASIVLHAALFVASALAVPALDEPDATMRDAQTRATAQAEYRFVVATGIDEPLDQEADLDGDGRLRIAERTGGQIGGALGDRLAADDDGGRALAGPPDNPNPDIGSSRGMRSASPREWIFGFGSEPREDPGLVAPWGGELYLGTAARTAEGHAKAKAAAPARGEHASTFPHSNVPRTSGDLGHGPRLGMQAGGTAPLPPT